MKQLYSIMILLLMTVSLNAQTTIWLGGSTDWDDPNNWSDGIPASGYTATIPASPPNGANFPVFTGGPLIDYSIQIFGGSLVFDAVVYNTGSVINSGGGSIINNQIFINAGMVQFNNNDGTFTNNGLVDNYGLFTNAGTSVLTNTAGNTFNNFGDIENFGLITNDGDFLNIGNIISTNTLVNNGNLVNKGFLDSAFGSSFTNSNGADFTNQSGAIFEINGTFINAGDIVSDGSFFIQTAGATDNSGSIVSNGSFDLSGPINNTGTFTNNNDMLINDSGQFENNNTFTNNGTITLSICGQIIQNANNTIAGTILNDGIIYEIGGDVDVTSNLDFGSEFTDLSQRKSPDVKCRSGIAVFLDENGNGTLSVDAIDKNSFGFCGATLVTRTLSQNTFTTADIGVQEITLTITDEFGFGGTCSGFINVFPFTAPVTAIDDPDIDLTCPADITVQVQPGAFSTIVTFDDPVPTTNCVGGTGGTDCPTVTSIAGYDYLGEYEGSKYFLSTTTADWHTANNAVTSEGGHMISISDAAENDFIRNHMASGSSIWLGYTDAASEGNWEWTSGESVTFINWATNEPNEGANANHARLRQNDGNWTDRNESNLYYYVLELPCNLQAQPCSAITNIPNATLIGEFENSKYFLSNSSSLNYSEAEALATNGGGHLATISDVAENEYIRSNLPSGSSAWLGYSDEASEGNYVWVTGEPTTYTNWANGEPNDSLGTDNFARIREDNGMWTDRNGATNHYYAIIEVDCAPVTTLFRNCSYGGTSATFEVGTYNSTEFAAQFPNNQLSSIRVPDGLKVTLYNGNLTGTTLELTADDGCLINNNFNDLATSMKVELLNTNGGGGNGLTIQQISGATSGSEFPVGESQVAYEVTDNCGNQEICIFNIIVEANPADIVLTNCPTEVVVNAAPGASSAQVSWVDPTATSNCFEGSDTEVTQAFGPLSGSLLPIGTQQVTYTVEDSCGNFSSCVFPVTVVATPAIFNLTNCPGDITLTTAIGATSATATWDLPSGTTDCFTGDVNVNQLVGPTSGSSFPIGTTTVAYVLSDDCGNSELCSFTVNVLEAGCDVNASSISLVGGATETTICVDGVGDPLDVVLTGSSTGTNSGWIITDAQLNILGLPAAPPFDLDGAGVGTCLIWYVRYDLLGGATVGANIADLTGCFDLSNSITVVRQAADGATVNLVGGGTSYTGTAGDIVFDVENTTTATNLSYWYIITDENDNILDYVSSGNTIDLSAAPPGECHVWGWSYRGQPDPVAGDPITSLADGACEEISSNFITVIREAATCDASASPITLVGGGTETTICVDGVGDPLGVTLTGTSVGANSGWIITDDANNILALPPAPPFDLDPAGPGTCLIWYVRYESDFAGNTVGNNLSDLTGCYDLSNGITVVRQAADGATVNLVGGGTSYTGTAGDIVFDVENTTTATNLSYWYIITDENDNILDYVSSGNTIDLSAAPPGECHVWGWSYRGQPDPVAGDPITSLADGACEEISSNFITVIREASCPAAGTVCDDGNANTTNDVEDGNCNCAGTPMNTGGTCTTTENLALNGTATESSEQFGATGDRAIDGNTNGDFWNGNSVALTKWEAQPWIEVDLGQISNIEEVRVYNRTDCCQGFLTNYHILVSATPFTSTNLAATQAQAGVDDYFETAPGGAGIPTTTATSSVGRYVRIQLEGTSFLGLAEIEIIGCSDPGACPAAGTACDDGMASTTNDIEDGDCGCAGTPCPIAGTACNDGDATTNNDIEDGNCNCTGTPVNTGGACTTTTNLALGGTATESSEQFGATGDRAIDGNTNGDFWNGNSVALTKWEVQPWFEIDLGQISNIESFNVYNRTDCCDGFLSNYHILISDVPFTSTNLAATIAQTGVVDIFEAAVAGTPTAVTAPANTTGRYVRIQLEGTSFLGLAEIEIIGCTGGGSGCPVAGTACDDGNANTTNDVEDGNCGCAGTPITIYDCPALSANIGDACNDGNANTANDVVNANCNCAGTPINTVDCPALSANIGDACNDGDVNTTNDVVNANCNCEGTPTNTGGCTTTTNVALNGTASQSSTLSAGGIIGSAEKAIDGNTNGVFFTGNASQSSVSATNNSFQPYWEVELDGTYLIEQIDVYNRTDGSDRSNDVYVLISDTPFSKTDLAGARDEALWEEFIPGLVGSPSIVLPNVSGKYVRVQMQGSGYLVLAEVEVYGCVSSSGLAVPNMLYFNAEKDGIKTNVDWMMAKDVNVDFYEVEVSTDGTTFRLLDDLNSHQVNAPRQYETVDMHPSFGENFYRLKVNNLDGTYFYSNTRRVNFEIDFDEVIVYPNPTDNLINIALRDFAGKAGTIEIYNNLGQRMTGRDYQSFPTIPAVFDVSNFVNGIYTISIKVDNHKRFTKKFVVAQR